MPKLLLCLLLALAACAPHAKLMPLPDGASKRAVVPVFTATNRQGTAGDPSAERAEELSFARIDVAIPPERTPGDIEYPRRRVNADTHFLVADSTSFDAAQAFRAALSEQLRKRAPADRDVIIYVHGFNTNFADGVLRLAQLTHDVGLNGVPVHFSWPSAANPLAYAYDRDSALFSRDRLEELLTIVRVPEARRVAVVAHSMGGYLTMETLRQIDIAKPGRVARDLSWVILISPDIDVDVFRTQVGRIKELPETFAVFLSDKDRALGLSARLTGRDERLGSLKDATELAEFDITLVNVSEFSTGIGHFAPGTSPALLEILARAAEVDDAFAGDNSGRSGILPGSVLTVQNVTEFILTAGGE